MVWVSHYVIGLNEYTCKEVGVPIPTCCPTLSRPILFPISSSPSAKLSKLVLWDLQNGTDARLSCNPGASMMQHTTVVNNNRMAYMILLAMELLHILGQQLQIAQAAEPKQQAAVLPREIIAPIVKIYFWIWKKISSYFSDSGFHDNTFCWSNSFVFWLNTKDKIVAEFFLFYP